MKVGNKLLNRVVAIGMMAVVLFCVFSLSKPEVAQAATYSFTWTESWRGDKGDTWTMSLNPVGGKGSQFFVTTNAEHTSTDFYIIVPENSFSVSWSQTKKGSTSVNNGTSDCTGYIIIDNKKYYYFVHGNGYPNPQDGKDWYTFNWSGASQVFRYSSTNSKYTQEDFVRFFITGKLPVDCEILDGVTSTDESTWQGGEDNPIKSDKLGTLVDMEKHYRSFVEMGDSDSGSVVTERTHHWGWNKKTSTGLNLSNNDSFDSIETYCYLKVYDVSKKNWITGNKTKIESDKFKKLFFVDKGDASKLMIEIKQTHIWNDILTKEVKEIGDSLGANDALHNLDYSYDFYFQLVGQKNGKYYKGDFVHFKKDGTAEEITGGKYDVSSNTAIEDENGDLKDNDDKKNGEGATGTGDNYNDAKNNADSVSNAPNSNTLDLDSAKEFINQVADVPKMIADIFSFLPDWVKYSFAFGFALIPILIIFKLIRG